MNISDIAKRFAERFGIDVPEVVDDAAAFDADGMPFFLMRVANEGESEYLVIAADLGEPPPERLEKLYEALLDAGHAFVRSRQRQSADCLARSAAGYRGGGDVARTRWSDCGPENEKTLPVWR